MKQPLKGPHHFTGVTRDVKANVDFWCRIMGLRFVKNTSSELRDDVPLPHVLRRRRGQSGQSVVTFLEFNEAPAGVAGDGDIHRMVLRVAPTPRWSTGWTA